MYVKQHKRIEIRWQKRQKKKKIERRESGVGKEKSGGQRKKYGSFRAQPWVMVASRFVKKAQSISVKYEPGNGVLSTRLLKVGEKNKALDLREEYAKRSKVR